MKFPKSVEIPGRNFKPRKFSSLSSYFQKSTSVKQNKENYQNTSISPSAVSTIQNKTQDDYDSFYASMGPTLAVARALGLFPVQGLFNSGAAGAGALAFSPRGLLSLISAATLIPLFWIVGVSVYYAAKVILSSKDGASGGMANATAGAFFYGNSAAAGLLLRGAARGWAALGARWQHEEQEAGAPLPPLHARLRNTALLIMLCAVVEHMLSLSIQFTDCQIALSEGRATVRECMREYSFRSHSFIFAVVSYNITLGWLIFFISKVATFCWNFQDLFLIQVSLALVTRFKHINRLVREIDIETARTSNWKRARELYAGTAELARQTSSLMAPLVLLSFGNNLYFICLQMLNGLSPSQQGPVHTAYFFGSFSFMVARVTCVALSAAAVPLEARRALPILRCCPTRAFCTEAQRLSQQLAFDEVALTGMGFFTVNRNFMLGVAGAIATYEVVLLQFDIAHPPSVPGNSTTDT